MGLEEVGVKLIVDGAASFGDAMSGALDAVTVFADRRVRWRHVIVGVEAGE